MVDDLSLALVCQGCWEQVRPFSGEICVRCGYGFPSPSLQLSKPLCGACRRDYFQFDFARSFSDFEGPLKDIIRQFKYHSHPSLSGPLARLLEAVYNAGREEFTPDLVIPVPLHRARERERGYNQACLLAQRFCKLARLQLGHKVLIRQRATQVQAGLSRRARRLNMAGAFKLTQQWSAAGKAVLLIDDVFTTGATLNECAKLLKANGARRVTVLTLARVIQR